MAKVKPMEKRRIATHPAEFFIVGLAMGITEDLLAIHFCHRRVGYFQDF